MESIATRIDSRMHRIWRDEGRGRKEGCGDMFTISHVINTTVTETDTDEGEHDVWWRSRTGATMENTLEQIGEEVCKDGLTVWTFADDSQIKADEDGNWDVVV